LKADFDVLVDVQQIHQITEAVFEEDGQDLAVSIEVPVGSTNDTDLANTEHRLSTGWSGYGADPLEKREMGLVVVAACLIAQGLLELPDFFFDRLQLIGSDNVRFFQDIFDGLFDTSLQFCLRVFIALLDVIEEFPAFLLGKIQPLFYFLGPLIHFIFRRKRKPDAGDDRFFEQLHKICHGFLLAVAEWNSRLWSPDGTETAMEFIGSPAKRFCG
jgi:hypothetical protein